MLLPPVENCFSSAKAPGGCRGHLLRCPQPCSWRAGGAQQQPPLGCGNQQEIPGFCCFCPVQAQRTAPGQRQSLHCLSHSFLLQLHLLGLSLGHLCATVVLFQVGAVRLMLPLIPQVRKNRQRRKRRRLKKPRQKVRGGFPSELPQLGWSPLLLLGV